LNSKPIVLIVDDDADIVTVLRTLLDTQYGVQVAHSGKQALEIAFGAAPPDLVLLDIMMPGLSGFDVCSALKADPRTHDIPVIFLSALSETMDEKKGFSIGAVDYITKPVSQPILLARIHTHLELKAAADLLRDKNAFLEKEVGRRTFEIHAIQEATMVAMGSLAETRDNETGNHIRRTQNYVRALANRLRLHRRFAAELNDEVIDLLYKSAPLHDIGKVGIPDAILLKPGRLTAEEFKIMKTHTTLGRDAIAAVEHHLGAPSSFLRFAREIALYHQEKWDGSGYPEQLSGDAIPLSARLMALADVYDALISRRVYKPAFPHDKAVEIIRAGRGSHFDPDIADAFLEIRDDFRAIAGRYTDSDAEVAATARA
jgi:putative two-component system response regulator